MPQIVHAVMYRDYQIGSICNSGAWGRPMLFTMLFTMVTDEVTCPGCRAKLDGGKVTPGLEPLPAVGYKAAGDTDVARFRTMARNLRGGYDVGGSHSRDALARLIDREIQRAGEAIE